MCLQIRTFINNKTIFDEKYWVGTKVPCSEIAQTAYFSKEQSQVMKKMEYLQQCRTNSENENEPPLTTLKADLKKAILVGLEGHCVLKKI